MHASAQQSGRLDAQLAANRAQHQEVCKACHTLEAKVAQVSKQSAVVEKQQIAHEADLQQLLGAVGGLPTLMQHACVTGGPFCHP